MRFFGLVNGILTKTSDQHNWTNLAEAWIEEHDCGYADSYRYFCGPLDRSIDQDGRIADVGALCIERWAAGQTLTLVGHSNGAAVLCGVIRKYTILQVDELHLIAGAELPDFEKNGLNAALRSGMVGRVVCHCSKDDDVLKLASLSRFLVGWTGLGYGDLGRVGPKNVDPDLLKAGRVVTRWNPGFGHSTYFAPDHFETTMRLVTGGKAA
jgi:hypothetical protein